MALANRLQFKPETIHRFLFMLALILAGEAIFTLPYHVARFFRPTVIEVFALSNTQLGAAQGIYGIVAMVAYFPGGALADRFPAGKLLAVSLWSTALGGIYMATFPGYYGSMVLWGFFGLTTILLFWAALIKATRDWGGSLAQGRAYGLLDGGRGLLAATLASIAVVFFDLFFPEDASSATLEDKKQALRFIIYGYSAVTAAVGLFVWMMIPEHHSPQGSDLPISKPSVNDTWTHIIYVLRMPAVWLQTLIVVCAYVGYKGFDNFSVYAVDVYDMNDVDAAFLVAIGAWMRPVAALAAGFLGDRFLVSRMCVIAFALLLLSNLFSALYTPAPGLWWVLFGNMLLTCIAIFGLRGLYFALFEEEKVPTAVTGVAVGLISVVGYTPDIFVTFVAGLLIDHSPGVAGHQHFFFFLATSAGIGLLASVTLMRRLHQPALAT
jgi:sugar phosphate permease